MEERAIVCAEVPASLEAPSEEPGRQGGEGMIVLAVQPRNMLAFTSRAWAKVVLPRLALRFRTGPIDWKNPPPPEES